MRNNAKNFPNQSSNKLEGDGLVLKPNTPPSVQMEPLIPIHKKECVHPTTEIAIHLIYFNMNSYSEDVTDPHCNFVNIEIGRASSSSTPLNR